MTVRASGTGSPLRRDEKKALARVKELVDEIQREKKVSRDVAEAEAYQRLRDANPKSDWKRRPSLKKAKRRKKA